MRPPGEDDGAALLVAAPGVDGAIVQRIREYLPRLHEDDVYRALLADALLERFAQVRESDYVVMQQQSRAAESAGFAVIR